MSTYYNIKSGEMRDFLTAQKFTQIDGLRAPNGAPVQEQVYGRSPGKNLCLRVYTSIVRGQAREVGGDAIRVGLFWKAADGTVYKVGGSKRVHRVENWAKNLQKRLDNWQDAVDLTPCPECGAPMLEREVKNKDSKAFGRKFLGCITWKNTKCKGIIWSKR